MGNKQPVPELKNIPLESQLIQIMNFYANVNDNTGYKKWLVWKDEDGNEININNVISDLIVKAEKKMFKTNDYQMYQELLKKFYKDKTENDKLAKSIKIEETKANLKF